MAGNWSAAFHRGGRYGFDQKPPSIARQRSLERQAARPSGTVWADPTDNIPIGGKESGSLTPQSNWESLFKPRIGKSVSDVPGMAGIGFREVGTGQPIQGFGDTTASASPSLEVMAQGGMNHAQQWSQPAKTAGGYDSGRNPLDILDQYQTPGTTAEVGPKFGWGGAFDNGSA